MIVVNEDILLFFVSHSVQVKPPTPKMKTVCQNSDERKQTKTNTLTKANKDKHKRMKANKDKH